LSLCAVAQSENAKPKFEVASVHPISRDELWAKIGRSTYSGLTISGGRVNIGGLTMNYLISTAFRLNPRLIVGVPLVSDDLFSVQAIMPEGATKDQLPEMFRALLEDRFHLKTHLEGVDQSGYVLVPGKGTLKLNQPREIDLSTCSLWTDDPRVPGARICHARSSEKSVDAYTDSDWGPTETVSSNGVIRDEYFSVSITTLASSLATHLSNQIAIESGGAEYIPVADRTGLTGEWDVVLEREDPMSMRKVGSRGEFQSYDPFEAYSSALAKVGLRLQKNSVRIEKLVVDHVDKVPTDN
jgi:uncharacterized protein (TIGR03435 family)